VLREKPNSWGHGVSIVQHRRRLDSLLAALKNLATRGLTAAGVLAFLHHRRIVPLMERPLCIFEMTEEADPVALARSRMLPTPLEWGLLTDKRRIPLRSASVRTPHLFHHGIPKVPVNLQSKGITSA
jgi:hypothetical protein